MNFIRKIKKGKFTYLAEVKTFREDGVVKQQHIRYVGKEKNGKTILSCSISDAQITSVKLSGQLMVLNSIAKSIGLHETLGEYSNEILSMVYAHCLDYKSLNQMENWFEKTDLNLVLNLEELTEKRLFNALDSINEDSFKKQEITFNNIKKYLNLTPDGIIYDVTNTYFYGKESDIAKYGKDKEKRKGYPLVQIGLAVTKKEGIPILHKTFPGNIHDCRTFVDISNDLESFNIQEGIIVIDRGITSADNSEFMSKKHWKLICGLKLDDNLKKILKFTSQSICIEKNRFKLNKTVFYCSEILYKHGNIDGRLLIIFNRKKAFEMEESRYDEIQEARERLQKNQTIKQDIQTLFDQNGNLLENELKEAMRFDGISLIFTTTDLSTQEIIKAYFDKDVVEKCFQSLKGVVRLRPIRHWLYNRVEAHIFICYLSSIILSILKIKVASLGISFTEALDELHGLYRVYLRNPKNGFQIDRLVALSKQQEKILKVVDKSLVKKCSV
jgi:transposase